MEPAQFAHEIAETERRYDERSSTRAATEARIAEGGLLVADSPERLAKRAALYFLLRYPAAVADESDELEAARLPLLLSWHEQEPLQEYEQHRNPAISEAQGNRKTLIAHPAWAARIEFAAGLG